MTVTSPPDPAAAEHAATLLTELRSYTALPADYRENLEYALAVSAAARRRSWRAELGYRPGGRPLHHPPAGALTVWVDTTTTDTVQITSPHLPDWRAEVASTAGLGPLLPLVARLGWQVTA